MALYGYRSRAVAALRLWRCKVGYAVGLADNAVSDAFAESAWMTLR